MNETKRITATGRVWGQPEIDAACRAVAAGHWTARFESLLFETALAQHIGVRKAVFCNSGSSANLLALSSLGIRKGMEVITPAATFPTTIAAILHCGLVPVFVDIEIPSYNATPEGILEAIGPSTAAVLIPHTLGNVVDLETVRKATDRWIIEDACDAFGSSRTLFAGEHNLDPMSMPRPSSIPGAIKLNAGRMGHLATLSFYPAHHITTGEGGAVLTDDPDLARNVRSFRDWGRDCWCLPGEANTCGKRFDWSFEGLPDGYDHKYVFSRLGYNLKPTDIQAAIGLEQLKRAIDFHSHRVNNWSRLYRGLKSQSHFILPDMWGSPFGFALTCREGVSRQKVVKHLDIKGIDSRALFAGNVLRQPGFAGIPHRVAGAGLPNTDIVAERTFWIGCWPGLSDEDIDYMIEVLTTWKK